MTQHFRNNAQKPMEFITEIAKQSEKHEGTLMTIAQQIEEIGIQKGLQRGIQQEKERLLNCLKNELNLTSQIASKYQTKIIPTKNDEQVSNLFESM